MAFRMKSSFFISRFLLFGLMYVFFLGKDRLYYRDFQMLRAGKCGRPMRRKL